MNYIILIILLGFFIYYKYNILYNSQEISQENFRSNFIKDKGLIIQVPKHGQITLVSDQHYNPIYYLGAILEQFGKNVKNEASEGSESNIKKIINGEAQFGLCNEKIFIDQHLGNNNRIANPELQFVMAFFREHIYIVSLNSYTPEDLVGKNIWIGNISNSSFFYLKLFAAIYGYGLKEWGENMEKKDRTIYYTQGLLPDILINFIKDDSYIDALFIISGPKLRYIMDINKLESDKVFFITQFENLFFESIMGSLIKKNMLNMELYKDPEVNYKSLYGSRVVLICHEKMDDEIVYKFVKNIIKNRGFLIDSMFHWGKQTFDDDLQDYSYHYTFTTPDMLSSPPNIKIHNGTKKFMKEIGLITNDPTQLCEFDNENNRCHYINPMPSKKPLWKLKKVDFPHTLFNWNRF